MDHLCNLASDNSLGESSVNSSTFCHVIFHTWELCKFEWRQREGKWNDLLVIDIEIGVMHTRNPAGGFSISVLSYLQIPLISFQTKLQVTVCCLNGLDYSEISSDLKIDRIIGAFDEVSTFHYTEIFLCIHYVQTYHPKDINAQRHPTHLREHDFSHVIIWDCLVPGFSLWGKYQILWIKKNAVLKINVYCIISKMSNCEFLHNYEQYLAQCSKDEEIPDIAEELVTLEDILKSATRKIKSHEVAARGIQSM